MKIQDYIKVLRKRGWIILMAAVMTAVSAFAFSLVQIPIYRSSVEVAIELARPDLSLTHSTKEMLRTYAYSMWSKQNAQEVINRLSLYMSPQELKNDVTIAADNSLMIIKFQVDNTDGDLANDIANAWADIFVESREAHNARQNKEERVYAQIIDRATQYRQLRPNTKINVVVGGILGLIIGAAIVFALEWMEAGIIRQAKELEQDAGLTVLGVIPPTTAAQ